MFTCHNCKKECRRLIAPGKTDSKGTLFCEHCYDRPSDRPSYLHQKYPGAEAKGLTIAKANIIGNRIISPDDKMVIIDKTTGRETQY